VLICKKLPHPDTVAYFRTEVNYPLARFAPRVALGPTCGAPMRVVMRLWSPNRAFVDTGGEERLGQETLGATWGVTSHGTRTRASSARYQAAKSS
jgi:hypothetical protein